MKSVIVGTAGHIDHGKTALVKALTDIDADRLEEEKRRGITIDIGFAHLDLPGPDGEIFRLGFVDVPGHERFVRNMLAGIGGIDLVLLVIAADESIKPQTREHFDICRQLSVSRGITVLTRSDLVDRETLDVVRLEVEDFLRGSFLDASHSPIIPVSSITGAGLDQLKQSLLKMASEVPAKDSTALARLPIDRVFTMKGFGPVVTGTLVTGSIRKDEELEVFPQGQRVRVWFPAAHPDAYQDVSVISATGDLTLKRTKENRFGNELYFAESSNARGGDLHFVVDYDVVRRERVTLGVFRPRLQDAALNKKEQQLDLAPEKLVPVTGLPADLAAKVTAGKSSTLDKAHAIYDYVFDNLTRQTGGLREISMSAMGVPHSLERVAEALKAPYRLSYTTVPDLKERKVEVKVARQGVKVRTGPIRP